MSNVQLTLDDREQPTPEQLTLYGFDRQYPGAVAGIDEAGRGCLAGDVFAAAVVLDSDNQIEGLNDSKKLSPAKRERLYAEITEKCRAYAIATANVGEIEKLNILHAALLAMKRAYEGVEKIVTPNTILIDGNKKPPIAVDCTQSAVHCIIKGDAKSASVAAASILAKVARDRYMTELDRIYPEYRFAQHKGYGTKLHKETLLQHGASPIHRKSFLKNFLF